jgi:hypothetical protein
MEQAAYGVGTDVEANQLVEPIAVATTALDAAADLTERFLTLV